MCFLPGCLCSTPGGGVPKVFWVSRAQVVCRSPTVFPVEFLSQFTGRFQETLELLADLRVSGVAVIAVCNGEGFDVFEQRTPSVVFALGHAQLGGVNSRHWISFQCGSCGQAAAAWACAASRMRSARSITSSTAAVCVMVSSANQSANCASASSNCRSRS